MDQELARRGISPELVKEFATCLSNADNLYEETLQSMVDQQISDTRSREAIRELVRDNTSSE